MGGDAVMRSQGDGAATGKLESPLIASLAKEASMKHKTIKAQQAKRKFVMVALLFGVLAGAAMSAQAADDWTLKGPHPWNDGRSNHAMGYAGGDSVVMFAGNAGFDVDDTCVYDLSQDFWFCHYPTPRPFFRKDHAMAYIGDDKVLLHGGWDDGNPYPTTGDTWVYDRSSATWTDMDPAGEPTFSDHAMAYIGDDKVVLFIGGYRREGVPSQWVPWATTQVYDLSDNAWTAVSPATSPPGREQSAMARIGPDKVVIFGGFRCTQSSVNPICDFYSDTWVYDLSDNTWSDMNPPVTPSQRFGHAMAYIGDDKVVMFGGLPYRGALFPVNDTWVYDLSDNRWTQDFNNINPPGVWHTAMSETSQTGVSEAVLFGGDRDWVGNDDSDETWTFGGGDFVLTESACFDGLDNDGDGDIDCADSDCNGATSGSCDTGQLGICAAGTNTCTAGAASCVADSGPQTEGPPGDLTCSDLLDNDCDGITDAFDLDCVDGNTPPGANVEVCDGTDTVCITFENVDPPGGNTTVTVVACETPPTGIILNQGDPTCVDIQTDAPFDAAWVCVPYDATVCAEQRICELETFDLYRCHNGTCDELFKDQDTDANIVCGLTDQLSLFFVGTALDSDDDGIVDLDDNCPQVSNFWQENSDWDDVGDACDNCTLEPNTDQRDTNVDGFGNLCDPDLNNDLKIDFADLAEMKKVFFTSDPDADLNGDLKVDFADLAIQKQMFFGPPGPSALAP
jgi:N-acetylneuraminic acid mutarotase